jgi:hypothetical protein|eukprot:COSAG02_NODE_69_length_42323_cov_23.507850_4_plen_63_part_00
MTKINTLRFAWRYSHCQGNRWRLRGLGGFCVNDGTGWRLGSFAAAVVRTISRLRLLISWTLL